MYVYMMLCKSVNNNLSVCSFVPYSLDLIDHHVQAVTEGNVSNPELR